MAERAALGAGGDIGGDATDQGAGREAGHAPATTVQYVALPSSSTVARRARKLEKAQYGCDDWQAFKE